MKSPARNNIDTLNAKYKERREARARRFAAIAINEDCRTRLGELQALAGLGMPGLSISSSGHLVSTSAARGPGTGLSWLTDTFRRFRQ